MSMTQQKTIKLKNFTVSNDLPFILIGGPCVIESEEHTLFMASEISKITQELQIPFIFKSSFDKANRSSISSYRGPGIIEGLKILQKVKTELNIPIISDIHTESQISTAKKTLDIIQIPAFLSRQTDLIINTAKTNKIINIKKGQFAAPWDMKEAINKIETQNNSKIILTERGTTFGYNNLVSDMRSLIIMKNFGYPVIYDATHSVQMPGTCTYNGQNEFIAPLAKAAISTRIAGLFVEIHDNPQNAKCDGPNLLNLKELKKLLTVVKKIDEVVKAP